MPREAPLFTDGLATPPVRRYTGPIVDAHVHVERVEEARLLMQVGRDYGVRAVCGVSRLESIAPLREAFGDAYRPVVWVDHTHAADAARFARDNVRAIREARALGAVAAKFWYSPRFYAQTRMRLDHPSLRPLFEALVDLGMAALVHVADPDCWFRSQYLDANRYGTKALHYEALERALAGFPALRLQGAHFGGDPEDLDHLRRLLDAYPNLHLDTSATKWVARELSLKPALGRAFLIERADRLVFGSDLVAFREAAPADYASRYWVHRWLWEGEGPRASPVPDPCAPWPDGPRVEGLALPDDVLARLYAGSARRLLGIEV